MRPREHEPADSRQSPPPGVATRLREAGLDSASLVFCIPTDIDRLGRYRREWLAVSGDRLAILAEDGGPPLVEFELARATTFRVSAGVGSGLLQATVDGVPVDLLRYSNRAAYRFERIAHRLERRRKGDAAEAPPDDLRDPRRCRTCGLLLDQPGESCPNCVNKGAVLGRMLKLMRPYRGSATAIMGLLLVGIALDLVSPQLTRFLVDRVFEGGHAAGTVATESGAEKLRLLFAVVLTLAGVQTARMIVNIINGRLASRVGTAITFDMRSRLVQHLQRLSVGFYDKQQVGSLVGRVAYDTESLHGFIWQLTGGFLLQILMVVGVGIMMFSINTRLALFALLPGPLVMGATVFFWRYIYPRYYRVWDASGKQAGALSGMLSGIRVIKAFSQERREHERFVAGSARLKTARTSVDGAITTFNAVVGLVFQLGGWIVWYAGGQDVLTGKLTLGELMAFFGYLWMFYGPLAALPHFTNWLTSFVTQANRLFELLDTPATISEPANPKRIAPGGARGEIEFNEVTFGYQRHSPVLKALSLKIAPGEMVGVVGASGSGKSTIVNLICRFYDVDEGSVRLDGADVREIATGELRGQIGVVLQDPFIFRGTIIENLAYGRPGATPEEVLAAAKAGNCHDFILGRAHGYDTWVGERGAGLSGGERQRLSIARVLLTDPRVLILDEATSSVDAESEAAIQAALAELVRGRTTIAIAHRLSTLRRADRILVVDNGRIIESGSHGELLEAGGVYARLVRLQSNAQDEEGFDLIKKAMSRPASAPPHPTTDIPLVGSLPPLRGHRLRWLTPDLARIHTGSFNTLHVTVRDEAIYGGVFAVRCLPVHHPACYISLRHVGGDGHDVEIGLLRDLADWPAEARALVEESLAKRYFVHEVRAIEDIRQVGGYLHFRVETDLGPVQFTMRAQTERAYEFGDGGKMLIDTDENRYLIPRVEALPQRDLRLFRRFVYW